MTGPDGEDPVPAAVESGPEADGPTMMVDGSNTPVALADDFLIVNPGSVQEAPEQRTMQEVQSSFIPPGPATGRPARSEAGDDPTAAAEPPLRPRRSGPVLGSSLFSPSWLRSLGLHMLTFFQYRYPRQACLHGLKSQPFKQTQRVENRHPPLFVVIALV